MKVLVLGASSDIGIATCLRYLGDGHEIVAHYRSGSERLKKALEGFERQCVFFSCDFSDPLCIEPQLLEHLMLLEKCDVIVNCCGYVAAHKLETLDMGSLIKHFSVNFGSSFVLLKLLGNHLAAKGWGRIVLLSSIGVKFRGGNSSYAYALAKNCLEFLPNEVERWAGSNVYTNVLRVGVTDTRIHTQSGNKDMKKRLEMIPVGRAALPHEIADFIFYLGSPNNSFISGEVIAIAGGE